MTEIERLQKESAHRILVEIAKVLNRLGVPRTDAAGNWISFPDRILILAGARCAEGHKETLQ